MADDQFQAATRADHTSKELAYIEATSNPEDPAAPSKQVSSKRQSLSDIFTIICAGFALISDGYQNNLMYVFLCRNPSSTILNGSLGQ